MITKAMSQMISHTFSGGVLVSVHFNGPGSNGGGMLIQTEETVSGGSFSFQEGRMINTREIFIGVAPRGSYLTHMGIWLPGGGFLIGGRMRTPVMVGEGDFVVAPARSITIQFGMS